MSGKTAGASSKLGENPTRHAAKITSTATRRERQIHETLRGVQMTTVQYEEVIQGDIQDRVRKRFASDIDVLMGMGFRLQYFCGATLPPLSAVVFLPILLLMLAKREVIWVHGLLQLTTVGPVLVHRGQAAYAEVLGLGVKYYTRFKDGIVLVTASFENPPPPVAEIQRQVVIGVVEAWEAHQRRVSKKEEDGGQIEKSVSFERYVDITSREESAVL